MPPTTTPLRIGVLGAAAIAPAALVKPARHTPGVVVAAVAARDPARAHAFATRHHIGRVHHDYAALLADPDIDAVYLPLPNGLHGAWTLQAVDAGKHVLCEKPFTADAPEAATVAAAVEATDRVVMEAFHWRYHPLTARALDIAATDLGEVHHIAATFSFPLLKRNDIRWSRDLAGGSLLDAGCYAVHQVRTFGAALGHGEPVVRSAHAHLTKGGVDRALRADLTFTDGPTASVRCGFLDPGRPAGVELRVDGSTGTLRYRNPVLPHLLGHLQVRRGRHRRWEWAEPTPSYVFQLRAFVDAIRDGSSFPTTPRDAVATMTVLDGIQRAAGIEPAGPTSGRTSSTAPAIGSAAATPGVGDA